MASAGLVSGAIVSALGHEQFRKVLNRLLTVEANIQKVPLTDMDLSCRDTDPDGGIDAKVHWPVGLRHDVLKDGDTVLQFKSGKVTLKQIETEFSKPGVRKALRMGARYVLMVGHDYVGKQVDERRNKLKQLCRKRKVSARKCEVLFGSQIARWISRHASVVVTPELGLGYPGFVTVEGWLRHRDLQNPWKPDAARTDIIEQIHRFARREINMRVMRIEGPAGVGKTRVALEGFRDISEIAIYTPNADEATVTQLLTAIQGDPQAEALVVVDECDRDRQEVLRQYADLAQGRLLLLCVGPWDVLSKTMSGSGVFVLDPLSEQTIREVLEAAVGTLAKEVADIAVRLAGGYVKLALFVTNHVLRQREIPPAELAKIDDIRTFLKRFVDPTTRRALGVLSLLWRVGWEEELKDEAEALAKFFQMDFKDLRFGAKALRDQGVVVPRGRFLYVSPDLLAISAAADLWDEFGADLIDVVNVLPREGPRRELLKRLASMGSQPKVRQAVERLLGTNGLFKVLSDLDIEFRSEAFSILASALPDAAIVVLERLIEASTIEELGNFRKGRRSIVWAIESLLRWPNTSMSAARSLMFLALSENESWANNATGVFCDYFHMYLSRSPKPMEERLVLIDELIQRGDPTSRLLATKAATSGLSRYETRSGHSIDAFSGQPYPNEWRPRTYQQLWDAREAVVARLTKIAEGGDEAAAKARGALTDGVFTLIADGMAEQMLRTLAAIKPQNDKERRNILEVALRLERDVTDRFSKEQIQQLRDIASGTFENSYLGRLKRWIGHRLHTDYNMEEANGYREADSRVRDLADEGYKNGISDPELSWLGSVEAENVWEFGRRLGYIDENRIFLQRILDVSPESINAVFLASYINGRASVEGEPFREEFLDGLAKTHPILTFGCTWRGTPSKRGLDRILDLVERGQVAPETLGYLAYASWTHSLSIDDIVRLVESMLSSGSSKLLDSAAHILMGLSSRQPESIQKTEPLMWRLVEKCPDRSWEWDWGQIAIGMASRNPRRMVETVVKFFESDGFVPIPGDEAMKVLQVATMKDPESSWQVIGDAMLKDDEVGMRLVVSLSKWYGELIPPNTLISWAKKNLPRGPWIVARIIQVRQAPLPERARALILNFPNDERIKNQFAASLQTGFSVGPFSNRIGVDLAIAEKWAQDQNPTVSLWARKLVKGLKAHLKRRKMLEEEEEF